MLTRRGWGMAVLGVILAGLGLINWIDGLAFLGFALLAWVALNWFKMRRATVALASRLRLRREVCDRGGPCRTLRNGQTLEVHCTITLNSGGFLALVRLEDRPPADMRWDNAPREKKNWFARWWSKSGPVVGWPATDGRLGKGGSLTLVWRGSFISPGVARFEGVRVTVLDPQALVGVSVFLRVPQELLVLPDPGAVEDAMGGTKRANHLLPPGLHRLRRPGGSSEILDIRDYVDGDSPRHIAWKLSARRDKIVVRDFETEVPIRCQLVLDGTRPLRQWRPEGASLGFISTVAAGIMEHSLEQRDPVGLVVVAEDRMAIRVPGMGGRHRLRLLQTMAESCADPGVIPPREEDPAALLAPSLRLARELYPDVVAGPGAAIPWRWVFWGPPRPGFSRYGGIFGWLYRHRSYTWLVPPSLMVIGYIFASGWMCLAVPLAGPSLWLLVRIASFEPQRRLRERKLMATLLAARAGGDSALLDALLEDDTLLSMRLRAFLAEHRADRNLALPPPAALRVNSTARAERLSLAILSAVSRARDPELHVLFTDMQDLGVRVQAIERAVRVSRSRRHEVLVVLANPTPVEPIAAKPPRRSFRLSWEKNREALATDAAQKAMEGRSARQEASLTDLKSRLAKLGVSVVIGPEASREAQRLMARLRRTGARVGGR